MEKQLRSKSLCILTGGSRIKQAAGDYLELCSDRRRESKEAVEVGRTSESLYGSCSNVASKKCAQPQFACGSTSASISIKRQRGADVFPLGLLVSKLAVARGREVSQSEIRNRSANDNWSTCSVNSACLGVLKWTEHEGFGLGGSLFAHARCSNRPIKDPTCSYTNSSTFLSRALKETALWQDATPISQNRDWIEWMSCETAADLKHCYKSQTARSAAARLGRDRQPGKSMHVLLCFHSKTAIVFILSRSAIVFAIVLHSITPSLLPTITIDCIVHTNPPHQPRLGSQRCIIPCLQPNTNIYPAGQIFTLHSLNHVLRREPTACFSGCASFSIRWRP